MEDSAATFWRGRRNSSRVSLTDKDAENVAFFERERPTEIIFTGPGAPVADLEMFRYHFHPTDGNVIQVYPLPQSTLVRKDSDEF